MTSVRLRFIDGLRRFFDHVVKSRAQSLGGNNIQPQSGADFYNRGVAKLSNEGAERQVNNAIQMANLCQDVNKVDPSGLVNDLSFFVAQSKRLTAANNYVVHQSPQSKNHPDLERLNARNAGVES